MKKISNNIISSVTLSIKDLFFNVYKNNNNMFFYILSALTILFIAIITDFSMGIMLEKMPLFMRVIDDFIPYNFIIFISFVFLVFFCFYSLYKYWSMNARKYALIQTSITFFTAFIIALIFWSFNFSNYYDGKESSFRDFCDYYHKSIKNILREKVSDEDKIASLETFKKDIEEKQYAKIIINRGGNEFYTLETSYDSSFYQIKEIRNKLLNKPFVANKEKYSIKFYSINTPFMGIALQRALTFSILPDIIKFDGCLNKDCSLENFNNSFIHGRLYLRSTIFWYTFLVFIFILIIESVRRCYIAKIENELNEVSNNMSALFYSAYNHLQREVSGTLALGRNKLQNLTNNYQTLDAKEIEALDNYLVSSARKERHDLNNKWTSDEVYKQNDDVKKYINGILEDLKNIPAAISIKLESIEVTKLLELLDELILKSEDRTSGLNLTKLCDGNGYVCKEANNHHFQSIVSNLIGNSKEATQRYKKIARENGSSDYKRMTNLIVDIDTSSDIKYLKIVVSDNGGGFKEIEKVYKETIISSKPNPDGSVRNGEGTSYIRVFTELMHGKIIAENIELDNGLMGAKTTILFPIEKA